MVTGEFKILEATLRFMLQNSGLSAGFFDPHVRNKFYQEPITRSLQLPHIPVTAFYKINLF